MAECVLSVIWANDPSPESVKFPNPTTGAADTADKMPNVAHTMIHSANKRERIFFSK
jgi:hypothetical protein